MYKSTRFRRLIMKHFKSGNDTNLGSTKLFLSAVLLSASLSAADKDNKKDTNTSHASHSTYVANNSHILTQNNSQYNAQTKPVFANKPVPKPVAPVASTSTKSSFFSFFESSPSHSSSHGG